MVSIGPFPMSIVVLALALAAAALTGRFVARAPGEPRPRVGSLFVDMLFVGLLAARLAFIVQWWPLYADDPWAMLRPGDGGYAWWAGVLAALAFGAWRARRRPALRKPLVWGTLAGLATWGALTGALFLMQQARIPLPDAELQRIEGGTLRLTQLAGRPVVVNLWATWCPPCRREMPVLAEAQRTRGGIVFVFANQGEAPDEIRQYLADGALPLHNVLVDPFSSVSRQTGARGLPTTLFFDARGRLVDTHVGELTRAGLANKLDALAPAPGARPEKGNP